MPYENISLYFNGLKVYGWALTNPGSKNPRLISSYCPTPFAERTDPEISIMLRPDEMPSQVEQI